MINAFGRLSAWFGALSVSDKIALIGVGAVVIGIYVAVLAWLYPRKPRGEKRGHFKRSFEAGLRARLLEKVQQERVEPRLRQGLREAIRVDLGLTEMPAAVPARLREYALLESGSPQERPLTGSVQQIFEQAGWQLLILGEPGAGKTNLMLELAEILIRQAKNEPAFPIPIVFSLPRWTLLKKITGRLGSLSDWMQSDLVEEYGLSSAAAVALVQKDRILPLLDGLDEVEEKHRAACVGEIHAYQTNRNLGPLVVCCRLSDYETLPPLDLAAAIRVEKLTREDVGREIAKPGLEYVRRAMERAPELWTIVDTPLWLHVLYGAAQVDPSGDVDQGNARDRLYARYVQYALGRTAPDSPRVRTSPEPFLRWLGWLAVWMKTGHQVEFVLRDLDYLWSASRHGIWPGGLFGCLVAGLVAGVIGGREIGWIVALGGATLFRISRLFWETYWRFSRPASGHIGRDPIVLCLLASLNGLAYGLTAALVGGWLHGASAGFGLGWRVGLAAAICSALSAALWFVELYTIVPRIDVRSRRFALLNFLVGGAPLLLFAAVFQKATPGSSISGIVLPLTLGWVSSSPASLIVGRHVVHLSLWMRRAAPLRYASFLNEAVDRLLLIRRGDSYGFLHITLRDYIARAYGPDSSSADGYW